MSRPADLDSRTTDRIDAIVADAVEQGQAPGIVAAVARGDAIHVATAGAMSVGGPPVRRDTLFRISSLTKPMTAATVLSLIDAGVLALDEPVDRLLPELADRQVLRRPDGPLTDTEPADRSVTVRDLLTFTWGFGMQGAMFAGPKPWPIVAAAEPLNTFGPPQPTHFPAPDDWLAMLGELPLVVQPGTAWLYQTGTQVLGLLAARALGEPFADVLRNRLLNPLGMRDTGFHVTNPSRLTTAYVRQDGALQVFDEPAGQWARPPAFADGSAGLVSSVDDVVAFGRMLMRGGSPVLTAATVAEMTRDQLTPEQRSNDLGGFSFLDGRGWGYGLSVLDDGRYSWDGGMGSTWSNVPELDLTVVTLTQQAWDETGPQAVFDDVLNAARAVAAGSTP